MGLELVIIDGAPALADSLSPTKPTPAPSTDPPHGDPSTWRRRDAVVDAARSLDDLSIEGVREFVKRRWSGSKVLQEADIEQFSKDAAKQRVEDVVDALDHRVRAGVFGRSKSIRVELPRGLAKRDLRSMSDEDIAHVVERLRARGWTPEQLRKHVTHRLDDPKRRMSSALTT